MAAFRPRMLFFRKGELTLLYAEENRILRRFDEELLCIEPWGANSLRVRATVQGELLADEDFALLPEHAETKAQITVNGTRACIVNGKLRCDVLPPPASCAFRVRTPARRCWRNMTATASARRTRASTARWKSARAPSAPSPAQTTSAWRSALRPTAAKNSMAWGQYQQDCLDLKGCIVELAHRNSQASVPFVLSDRGYGLLWNNPAVGRVTFGKNVTEWTARSTRQMDYWITAGDTPAEIEEAYMTAVGKPPMMPDFGTGFWQCKAALPDAGRTAGDRPRVQAPRPADLRDRHRLLPLAAPGRLVL